MRLLAFAFTIVFVWTGPKRFVLSTRAILVYAFLVYCQHVVYKSGLCPMRCLKVCSVSMDCSPTDRLHRCSDLPSLGGIHLKAVIIMS